MADQTTAEEEAFNPLIELKENPEESESLSDKLKGKKEGGRERTLLKGITGNS